MVMWGGDTVKRNRVKLFIRQRALATVKLFNRNRCRSDRTKVIGLRLRFGSAATHNWVCREAFSLNRMCSVFRTELNKLQSVLCGVTRDQQWNCGTILRGETQNEKKRKTLLAGVAALALIAGTGFAAAQQDNGMSGSSSISRV